MADKYHLRVIRTIDDLTVWLVDGEYIRGAVDLDFTEGGNDAAYPEFIPPNEIWVDSDTAEREWDFIILHEVTERNLMKDEGLTYDEAHARANVVELAAREKAGLEISPRALSDAADIKTAQGLNATVPSQGGFATGGKKPMPYKLKGNCVIKSDTGEKVKCHPTRAAALAHLRALMVNVEDAKKSIDAFKAGARHNKDDMDTIQTLHDLAVENTSNSEWPKIHDLATSLGAACDCEAPSAKSAPNYRKATPLTDAEYAVLLAAKSMQDAPGLRVKWAHRCENCKNYQQLVEGAWKCFGDDGDGSGDHSGYSCVAFDFQPEPTWVCDKWAKVEINQTANPIPVAIVDDATKTKAKHNPFHQHSDGNGGTHSHFHTHDDSVDHEAANTHLNHKHSENGKSLDQMIALGSEIKSLGNGKYGGLLIRFTKKGDYDLTSDRFDAQTDYGFKRGETKTVPLSAHFFFHHAQPLKTKSGKQMQIEDEIGSAELSLTDEGVEVIAQARKEYDDLLARSYKSLGWSSGTANHLVIREPEEKGFYIKRWLLGDDVSVTPMPAESRNAVYAMKSLPQFEIDDALLEGAEGTANPAPAAQGDGNIKKVNIGGNQMDEKEIKALIENETKALTQKIEEQDKQIKKLTTALEKEPPRAAGVSVAPEQKYPYKPIHRNTKTGQIEDATGYGEFLIDVMASETGTHSVSAKLANWNDMNSKAMKAAAGLQVEIPSQGGFFVQTDHSAELVREIFETGSMVSRVRKIPLGANADSITLNGVDETSRASTIWGGILAYWVQEATAATASKPKFRQIKLEAKGLAALYYATDKLLKIAPALGAEVAMGFREAMTVRIEDSIVNGTGAGKPLGILNAGSTVTVSKETNQVAGTILHENLVNMKSRLFPDSWGKAVWLANSDCAPQIDAIAFTIGASGVLSPYVTYTPEGVTRILGRDVLYVEHCQSLGTLGDLILWDPTSYYYIDLGTVEEASSIHVAFTTFDTAFRFIYYCDGQPKLASPLTPMHGSNTLTNQVILQAR